MNLDEKRLKDIQLFKEIYYQELDKAETISDCIQIQDHIDKLQLEEKEILERCDAL